MKIIFTNILIFVSFAWNGYSQHPGELNDLAISLISQGKVTEAIEQLDSAIVLDSTFFLTYYNKGVIYRDIGNVSKAVFNFEKALEIDPKDLATLKNLGIICAKHEIYDLALNYFEQAKDVDSLNKEIIFNIGLVYKNTQQLQNAKEAFLSAVKIDSNYTSALFRLAQLEILDENADSAFFYLNKCIDLNEWNYEYYETRAVLYLIQENEVKACADLQKAISLGCREERYKKFVAEKCN